MEKKKFCSKCKEQKDLSNFTNDKQKSDGLCGWCKLCRRENKREHYKINADRIRKKAAQWRKDNPQRRIESYRNSRYNIDSVFFEKLFTKQKGECAICHRKFGPNLRTNIDHDHKCCPVGSMSCGKCIRGLLCNECNKSLGMLHDSIENFKSAVKYLRRKNVRYAGRGRIRRKCCVSVHSF